LRNRFRCPPSLALFAEPRLQEARDRVGRIRVPVKPRAALDPRTAAIQVGAEELGVDPELRITELLQKAVISQAVSSPTPSSIPNGPTGIFMMPIQARSTSSTEAIPFATSVIASRLMAV
jgi:hypothetical protein